MSTPQKDIELSPVKPDANTSTAPEKLNLPVNDEEDVIIGRFRKISSAKSMAATNGNIQYPSAADVPMRSEDVEAGLQFKTREPGEKDRLLPESATNGSVTVQSRSPVTKSSFRDIEKPSRFKDQPSATRFQGDFEFDVFLSGASKCEDLQLDVATEKP
uniref:SFRICE_003407 n=1 Tax=Spodoptera frugiperda TaxID=7108 RepID=A0A2H1V406_SPOFR